MMSEKEHIMGSSEVVKAGNASDFDLEFVNVGAISEVERQRNQRLVRSTAMKSFRRRQLSERSVKKDDKKSEGMKLTSRSKTAKDSKPVKSPLSPYASAKPPSEVPWLTGSPNPSDQKAGYFAFVDNFRSGSVSSQSSRAQSVIGSPITPLGAGRVDPFRSLPIEPGSHINEFIDHSVTSVWPGLRPRNNGIGSAISSAWLEKIYERPVVMHALLFGASVHIDVLRNPRRSLDNPIRLHHKVRTMALLKEELKSPEKTPLDEVLLAVLCLAANEVETFADCLRERRRSPFTSPLTSVQWLDVYGSITHISAHTLAMRSLVHRRGGLEKVELEGLAEVLSFADILGATQNLSAPYWPILNRTKKTTLGAPTSSSKLGCGFKDLISVGVTERACRVFREMAELTSIIDEHCQGRHFIPRISTLIDHRNNIQHALLSLPRSNQLAPGEVGNPFLYDAIRLAAIIYSAAVTFPLPPLAGIFGKFSASLRGIIESAECNGFQEFPKVMLWILILGGIAATGTEDREWFVKRLVEVSVDLTICQWDGVAEEIEEWLWLDSACEIGGRLLWGEVVIERVRPRGGGEEICE